MKSYGEEDTGFLCYIIYTIAADNALFSSISRAWSAMVFT